MKTTIYDYGLLKTELDRLLNHPTYQFLQAEAQYYEYKLEQQPGNPYAFQVGNNVFYVVEYFNCTVENFLENVLIPRFREFSTERITYKRFHGSGNAAASRIQFVGMLEEEGLTDLKPSSHFYTRPNNSLNSDWNQEAIPYYEEYDQLKTLWYAYDVLENYALTLKSVKFIRTHHGPNLKFEIFIDEKQPFVFTANSSHSLKQCFFFLNFVEFYDLIKDNKLKEATNLAEKYLSKFLTLTPGITTRFDFIEHCVYCLMAAQGSFLFNKYGFKCRELAQLIIDINHFRHQNDLIDGSPNEPHIRNFNNGILITNTNLTDTALFAECDEIKGYHFTK